MDSDLYIAVTEDDIDVIIVKNMHEVRHNELTAANNTVLHLACEYGSMKCLDLILSAYDESLLLQINSRGETALHLAARQGHYDAAEALINKAKSWDSQVPNNLENTSLTVLQNLIRAPNVEFETALHVAVRYTHGEVVELLVKEDPTYSYPPNKFDETPLYLAAVRCNAHATSAIIDNCESPTFGGPYGRTALHAAVMNCQVSNECMRLLLAMNQDLIKASDNNGWTVFHYVANHDYSRNSIQNLLNIDKSVAYLADKKYKRTALHIAAYQGRYSILSELLKSLPDIWESVDGKGQNILHIIVTQNHKILLDYIFSGMLLNSRIISILLNQRDNEGNTPFHLIAKFEFYCYKLQNALEWNADWDAVNTTNFNPKQVLCEKNTGSLVDQALVGVTFYNRGQADNNWKTWIDDNVRGFKNEDVDKESHEWYKEMVNTHMIVAALITTVALTAGFAMPGGFDGNQGPNQGSAVLLRKKAFKIFMVADTVALLFSISSLFLYFLTPMNSKKRVVRNLVLVAVVLNVVSITALMLAFIAGTSVVLSHSFGLIVSVSGISSLFFLLVFFVCFLFLKKLFKIGGVFNIIRTLWRIM